MEKLVDAGLVKNIGCSNIMCQLLRDLLSYARHKPANLQIELHPYLVQTKLIRYCHENGVSVTAYSSFGGGSYVEMGRAQESDSCLTEPLIKELAAKHGKQEAQIALRWALQRGTAVIPKSSNSGRMAANLDLLGFSLTDEEMKSIDALDKNRRFNDPGHWWEIANNTFFPIFD